MKHSIARLFKKNIQKGINYHTAESQTYVQSVLRLNHIKNNLAPVCTMCDKRIVNKEDLEKHMTFKAANGKVCSECFNSQDIMNPHMLDNHGFKCAICEDTVTDKPQLKAHMTTT